MTLRDKVLAVVDDMEREANELTARAMRDDSPRGTEYLFCSWEADGLRHWASLLRRAVQGAR